MKNTINIPPHMITWARERNNNTLEDLITHFPKLTQWESGEERPTLAQLEKFAHKVMLPIGYFFLPNPIEERLPITDFRTVNAGSLTASINLLDTIHDCQRKQHWYSEYAKTHGFEPLSFIGSATLKSDIMQVVDDMRNTLQFFLIEQKKAKNFEESLQLFRNKIEEIGVIVMVSGIVANNTHRPLSVHEFRGFALSDSIAPIIFVNGSDSKSAQMFTLAHELAHLWLGESGISDIAHESINQQNNIEAWCNKVAAEFLMPQAETLANFEHSKDIKTQIENFTHFFKVSGIVVIRRLFDLRLITRDQFFELYNEIAQGVQKNENRKQKGGDFYKTLPVRAGKRFTKALLTSTFEGHTLIKDAFTLLGIKKAKTLTSIAQELGVFG